MKNKVMAFVATAALAASIGLVGCGGSQPAESASDAKTEPTTTEPSATVEKTDETTEATDTTQQTEETSQAPVTATPNEITVSLNEAKDIALNELQLTEADVTNLTVERDDDPDDPVRHYDVEFEYEGMEYHVEVDASDGSIHQVEVEAIDD